MRTTTSKFRTAVKDSCGTAKAKDSKQLFEYYHYPKPANKKKNEWDEYVIKAYDDKGKRMPKKDVLSEDFDEITARYKKYLSGKLFSNRDKEIKP